MNLIIAIYGDCYWQYMLIRDFYDIIMSSLKKNQFNSIRLNLVLDPQDDTNTKIQCSSSCATACRFQIYRIKFPAQKRPVQTTRNIVAERKLCPEKFQKHFCFQAKTRVLCLQRYVGGVVQTSKLLETLKKH